jgi:hypothetical protein
MCEDFSPNFGDRRTGCCITATHRLKLSFFSREFLTNKNMNVDPHPPYSPDLPPCDFSISPIEDETETLSF